MQASIQNLIQELTAVIFEKDELEFRERSELKTLLTLLAYQDSNSYEEILIRFCFRYKAVEIDTLMGKNELGRVEEVKV